MNVKTMCELKLMNHKIDVNFMEQKPMKRRVVESGVTSCKWMMRKVLKVSNGS
jgi:hypothetical protein